MRWADETLPEDDAEVAITLRRACDIGMGRGMDLDAIPVASQLPQIMAGVCHSMQPGVIEVALRHVGSIRDFADRAGAPRLACLVGEVALRETVHRLDCFGRPLPRRHDHPRHADVLPPVDVVD